MRRKVSEMAKFSGRVGYVKTVESIPDIWTTTETVKPYRGDLIRDQRRWEGTADHPNEDLTVSNEVSIVADKFAYENLDAIKWVEVYGAKWKVNSVTLAYPRINLTLGGVYNGG